MAATAVGDLQLTAAEEEAVAVTAVEKLVALAVVEKPAVGVKKAEVAAAVEEPLASVEDVAVNVGVATTRPCGMQQKGGGVAGPLMIQYTSQTVLVPACSKASEDVLLGVRTRGGGRR
jgi:hypothetical protein